MEQETQERDRPCTCHLDDHPPVPCAKKYALRDCRLVEGSRLFKAMSVQPGVAIHHTECDVGGPWRDEVRVMVNNAGAYQLLLSDEDEDVCRFFAWIINNFAVLTAE